jgi:hypothetical protein
MSALSLRATAPSTPSIRRPSRYAVPINTRASQPVEELSGKAAGHASIVILCGTTSAFWFAERRVVSLDQVTVPAQDRVGLHDQPQASQRRARQRCEQGGEKRPIRRLEREPAGSELPLQHTDLVAQGEDLDVLVAIAHR